MTEGIKRFPPSPGYIQVTEYAARTGVPVKRLYSGIAVSRFPYVRHVGRLWVPSDLDAKLAYGGKPRRPCRTSKPTKKYLLTCGVCGNQFLGAAHQDYSARKGRRVTCSVRCRTGLFRNSAQALSWAWRVPT